mmetsp:Transcript_54104/g.116839  ORF Transcript_54104/g.116839 Transcript_54104/m.116839 type:complete len:394 (-) Transcript_54104:554-1735(-)
MDSSDGEEDDDEAEQADDAGDARRRKVVLVRAQETSIAVSPADSLGRAALGRAGAVRASIRAKARGGTGPSGRIFAAAALGLGQSIRRLPRRPPGLRAEPPAKAVRVSRTAPALEASAAAAAASAASAASAAGGTRSSEPLGKSTRRPVRRAAAPPVRVTPRAAAVRLAPAAPISNPRGTAINALKLGEAALRSASPCSPEPVPARRRRRVRSTEEPYQRPSSPSASGSSSPVEVVSGSAAKRPRVAAAPDPAPAAAASGNQRGVISAADEGTFQAAVLDRLRSLCGEHEDAKVLAEYIVVMVAGSKGREDMAVELRPFFSRPGASRVFRRLGRRLQVEIPDCWAAHATAEGQPEFAKCRCRVTTERSNYTPSGDFCPVASPWVPGKKDDDEA